MGPMRFPATTGDAEPQTGRQQIVTVVTSAFAGV